MIYLVKACLFLVAFYLPFALILKRTTFFHLNRAYLMAGLVFSFVLPLHKGFSHIPTYVSPQLNIIEPIVSQTETVIAKASAPDSVLEMAMLLLIIYLVGIAIRLVMLIRQVSEILEFRSEGVFTLYQNLRVYKTHATVPFTFFRSIFLPKNAGDEGILEHEAAHVRQNHWLDLLLVELVSTAVWFNPLMVYYKRSLKQQHEYLADRAVIGSGVDLTTYLLNIKRQVELDVSPAFTSQFNFKSIKSRISMLTKKRTSVYALSAYAIVLPIMVFLLMAFSSGNDFQIANKGSNKLHQGDIALGLPIDKNAFTLESGFGERMHPTLKVKRLHTGIDLVAEGGVPVVAAEEGVVVKAAMEGDWGNIVVVQHSEKYSTAYSHLRSMSVKKGDKVGKAQEIGLVGNTGRSEKNHLHFELRKNGNAVDPMPYLPEIK